MSNFDYIFKYIIIGDAAVGKTNLLNRYINKKFLNEYQTTIGVEFATKTVKIRDKLYRIQLWDTTGQESFRSITRNYYKNSVCAIIVYDITCRDSFNSIKNWIEEVNENCSKNVYMVLVGNKSDLEERRDIKKEEGEELAQNIGIKFYETSAKLGTNVENVFFNSVDEIAKRLDENYYDLSDDECGIKKNIENEKNKKNKKIKELKKPKKNKKKC